MKYIQIGSVKIPLDLYTTSGTALLGTKGSGKTYASKGIAEQLLDHSIPIVVFDAIGVWRHLKTKGDGPNARGFKVVVAGGKEQDLPLTPQSAPELVRAAIRENISLVIDLYDKRLSKSDWRKIVQQCFRVLLYENEGLRHIFLEETAEYAPQKVFDGETYAEVEKLVRMGGNASLGITLINQRSQEVNKAVLDLCENLVLMKQRGSNAIDALEKWMDKISPDFAKQIAKEMPNLGTGECWVFPGDGRDPTRIKTARIHSHHPDRTKPDTGKARPVADTAEFLRRMQEALPKLAEEQKAADPAALRRKVAELERTIATHKCPEPVVLPPSIPVEVVKNAIKQYDAAFNALRGVIDNLCVASVPKRSAAPLLERQFISRSVGDGVALKAAEHPKGPPARRHEPRHSSVETVEIEMDARVEKPMPRAMLTAMAQHPEGLTKGQVLIHTGYRSSGPVSTCFAELARNGFVRSESGKLFITDLGLAALGSYDPLPVGAELREYLLRGDKVSTMEKAMLKTLFEVYPDGISKGEILERTGYASSGPVSSAFARLISLGYAKQAGRSMLVASEEFFK